MAAVRGGTGAAAGRANKKTGVGYIHALVALSVGILAWSNPLNLSLPEGGPSFAQSTPSGDAGAARSERHPQKRQASVRVEPEPARTDTDAGVGALVRRLLWDEEEAGAAFASLKKWTVPLEGLKLSCADGGSCPVTVRFTAGPAERYVLEQGTKDGKPFTALRVADPTVVDRLERQAYAIIEFATDGERSRRIPIIKRDDKWVLATAETRPANPSSGRVSDDLPR